MYVITKVNRREEEKTMKTYKFAVHNMTSGNSFWFYKKFSSAYYADRWAMNMTFSNKNNHHYNIIPTFD